MNLRKPGSHRTWLSFCAQQAGDNRPQVSLNTVVETTIVETGVRRELGAAGLHPGTAAAAAAAAAASSSGQQQRRCSSSSSGQQRPEQRPAA